VLGKKPQGGRRAVRKVESLGVFTAVPQRTAPRTNNGGIKMRDISAMACLIRWQRGNAWGGIINRGAERKRRVDH